MNNITELLSSMTDIGIRIIGSDTVNRFMTVIFGIILIFGIMNCILGYRLLRFWMMLGGFFVGAAIGICQCLYYGNGNEIYIHDRSSGNWNHICSDCIFDL